MSSESGVKDLEPAGSLVLSAKPNVQEVDVKR